MSKKLSIEPDPNDDNGGKLLLIGGEIVARNVRTDIALGLSFAITHLRFIYRCDNKIDAPCQECNLAAENALKELGML